MWCAVLQELLRQWPDEPEKQREVVRKIVKRIAIESLRDTRDWFYRRSALQALAELGDENVISQILPLPRSCPTGARTKWKRRYDGVE
ncbi:MAG: hypothetical protein ACK40X_05130 [Armatimonadota bacterium]